MRPSGLPSARLALYRYFADTAGMKDVSEWQVPKWPFLSANVVLIAMAFILFQKDAHARYPGLLPTACVMLGTLLGCLPFIMEYRATKKLVEMNTLSTVAEQLADLKKYSEQIAAATGQWSQVQAVTKGDAEKTVAAAREIAGRMAEEIREFNEFQVKLNDTEKGALRLEVDKLRRTEAEWLQVFARVLDHIFALYNAAARSGNPDLAAQIGHFQTACRDAARRVGLSVFMPAPEDKFDAQKHRAHGVENPPAEAVIAETLAPGMTFQRRLLRPALVRLQEPGAPTASGANAEAGSEARSSAEGQPPPVAETKAEAGAEPAPESGELSLGQV